MKNLIKFTRIIFVFIILALCLTSCKQPTLPSVVTSDVTDVTQTSATGGGVITDDGNAEIISRGVCWSTSENPSVSSSKTSDGTGTGSFSSTLAHLTAGTNYYVRAYATNIEGTVYGIEVTFATSPVLTASITTNVVESITQTTAVTGGIITSDGGGAITARGVCWSKAHDPTIADKTTNDGTGEGSFVSNISGLQAGTTYYVRSYATNSAGIAYGNEQSFITSYYLPTVITTSISERSYRTAKSGGNVVSDGGTTVTGRGVCWSTHTDPTINESKTIDGSGSGSFISSLTGLIPGTSYYYRAYATNVAGTGYGMLMSFVTVQSTVPSLNTSEITGIAQTSASGGGVISSDGGETITARGVCWSTLPDPTTNDSKTSDGTWTDAFTSSLSNLSPGTAYYVRAYATSNAGTGYGNEVTFSTLLSDIEGNIYKTKIIGTQLWMAENLKTTKFNNGSDIPLVTENTEWINIKTPAYCWYNNDISAYKNNYGALYNWYTVDLASSNDKNVCPTGWHVPTDFEWTILTEYLGGIVLAGGKLKETGTIHWQSPNTGATNESGFTALPGGERVFNTGLFYYIGFNSYWWSTTENSSTMAWCSGAMYNFSSIQRSYEHKNDAFSVRCLKDK